MNTTSATLRLLDKADREILRLPRTVKGALYDFQHKFKATPRATGLQLKQLNGESRLWSARVNDEYRALLLRLGDNDWLIVSVKHRKEVYENLDRLAYGINQITGGIEYVDLQVVEERVLRRAAAEPRTPAPPAGPEPSLPETLFARFAAQQLIDLGVAEPLVPVVRTLTTEDQLLVLIEYAPQLTGEILLSLFDGKTYEDVLEQVTA